MLKSEDKGTRSGFWYAKKDHKKPEDEVTVYTTSYGTQYVLPVDLLFSRDELLGWLQEALVAARNEKETRSS
jgi:hypothetical protein